MRCCPALSGRSGLGWALPGLGGGLALLLLFGAGCGQVRVDSYGAEGVAPRSVLQLRWRRKLVHHSLFTYRPEEWASACFGKNGTVYIGSSSGRFLALSPKGELIWEMRAQGGISSQPWYNPRSSLIYFGADDGRLYAVEAATGKVRWSYATKGRIRHKPAYSNGLLLFTSSENRIYAVDALSGRWRWQYDREHPEGFNIAGHAGVLLVEGVAYTGFSDGRVVALKAATGEVIWTKNLGEGKSRFVDVDSTPQRLGHGLILASSYSGGVFALTREGGSVSWRKPLAGVTGLSVDGTHVYAAAPTIGLIALDNKGRERWRQAIPSGLPLAPTSMGSFLLVNGTEMGLAVARVRTGELVQYFDPRQGISAPVAVHRSSIAVLSNGGYLYVFDLLL
ncbi:MAG: PQQ-binding-like beta-propeller repeat protein [Deltaproteobacteria bacterium]|nr:PQQ-binding-like beta-propeller repeat protein [Deltaproteobacteria bacterium]